ncbi:MAG: AAA family ATPase [Hydrogenophilales bacterium CG_4_9_14_3_um_filter_59_35]|nr:MAG: AAA family ATPase [Hydrogenophilales bacterium CG18_big_fil_WC_8_21_14_2_50_58_12]PIY01280.1 MAG: AAA family ATPase [Hydrogenophilales bacterium CG_4_10_14_3_um_filter_58_23]PJB08713.1 MAG: AAA family ATPase [Hydrogenophilales bacterium CG_4_9_14_3_um_filter_59_35]
MLYSRPIKDRIIELLHDFRIVYLTGPRQAGKSTLAREIAKELGMGYYTFDDAALLASAQSDPQGLLVSLRKPLVLDEFQMVPSLIGAIKMISDCADGQKGLFLLTGSSDIFRSAQTQEALPGHMARVELYPLSHSERRDDRRNRIDWLLGGVFDDALPQPLDRITLGQMLMEGGYPEAIAKSPRSRSAWFASYAEGRLLKDFETMHQVKGDYHSRLSALIRYLAGITGNLVKYANIANDLSQDDKTVKRYMEILELMFIIRRLNPYVRNSAKRAVVGMPKLHFVDTGLACHLLGLKQAETLHTSQFFGGLVENFVYGELLKHAAWSEEEVNFTHFRDTAQHELDLVIERSDGKVVGVEVKASMSVRPEDFSGLASFADYAREKFLHGILFYSGDKVLPFRIQGTTYHAVPISTLLGVSHIKPAR